MAVKLTINNSLCKIEGLGRQDFDKLRKLLSYSLSPQKAYWAGGHQGARRNLMDLRGAFPAGLTYIVDGFLKQYGIQAARDDLRRLPSPRQGLYTLSLPYPPYPEQKAAAEACRHAHRGIVVAPTGTGKNLVCALIIDALQVPTLVVVPSLELKRQLTETLRQAFGTAIVGPLSSKHWCPIAVENVDALDPKRPLKGYDCVIVDEFHRSGAATYRKLNQKSWGDVYFKFGLTATPFRSRDEERLLLESVLSKVIYRVDYRAAVDAGYIVPLEAYYIDLPKQKMKGASNHWASVYSELVVNNTARNEAIAGIMRSLHASGASNLTLVKEIAHGETLAALTGAGFANGQGDDCQELIAWFSSGQLRSLIGTTGVVGEGVDTRACEWVILAGGGKSKNQFMQSVGRAFRRFPGKESAKVILIRDASNKYLLDHFNACIRYLREEYGVEAVKLPLP